MQFELSLNNFRGFKSTSFVPIRPLTLLVGENSAGKSSFLASLQYYLDFFGGFNPASFNSDPFQLGTFQQIAHYRGGKAGRARSFDISVRGYPRRSSDGMHPSEMTITLCFENIDSEAEVRSIRASSQGHAIVLLASANEVSLQLSREGQEQVRIDFGGPKIFPRRRGAGRIIGSILTELEFYLKYRAQQPPTDDLNIREAVRLSRLAGTLIRAMQGEHEATSAIRTKPLRTYTPGVTVKDGQGSHVPFELASLYRAKNKDAWLNLKRSIDSFGRDSEMFKELNIKSFGSSISDPFQLQFSLDGPKMNIVDLGYGTSQVLPILHMISSASKNARFLIQQPEVHLHPRAQAALGAFFVKAYKSNQVNLVIETHSDFIIDRIRNAIMEGQLKPDEISLLFFERKKLDNTITHINLGDDGSPIDAPESYRTFFIDEQMKLLGI
ncbi:AAA family ATPase [Prosthecomicrobium sp. N25]|uniref:AAA family ATPase n=1 Tax=Prosthecomicrobium sp. N25 TaxID=3129254 RepID=UPI0030787706